MPNNEHVSTRPILDDTTLERLRECTRDVLIDAEHSQSDYSRLWPSIRCLDNALTTALGPRDSNERHGYLDPLTPLLHHAKNFLELMDGFGARDDDELLYHLKQIRRFANPDDGTLNYSVECRSTLPRRGEGTSYTFLLNPDDKPVGVRYLEDRTGQRYY